MFCGLLLSSCVDMDLSPKDSPSEASVWSDPTMAEQVVTGVYKNLNHIPNDPYNMWMDLFTGMMDRDANWSNFGILVGALGRTTSTSSSTLVQQLTRLWNTTVSVRYGVRLLITICGVATTTTCGLFL